MGLKDKNNPLGQHTPSDKVGGKSPGMEHNQSADAVERIKERAARGENDNEGREPLNTPKPLAKKIPNIPDASPEQVPPSEDPESNPKKPA